MKAQNRLQTNGASSGRVRFVIDPATGKAVFTQGNQVTTVDLPQSRAIAITPVEEGEAPRLTRAQQRLQRYREVVEVVSTRRVDVPADKEPFWVKRGNFPELTMAAQLAGRNKKGVLTLQDSQALASFVAALLRTFTVNGETDLSCYFESLEDARAFVDDCAGSDAASLLFYAIVDLNAEVFPEGAQEAKKIYAALMEIQTLFSTPPSSAPESP